LAVRLRLRRMGRKKRPFYRIVAADQRSPRDGRFIETLGYYDPLVDSKNLEIKRDRVTYWLEQGAQPSGTVKNLLQREGIIHRLAMQKQGYDSAKIEEEMKKWELLQVERAKRKEAKLAQAASEKKKAAAEKKEAEKSPPEPVAEKTEAKEVKEEEAVISSAEPESEAVPATTTEDQAPAADTGEKEEKKNPQPVEEEPAADTKETEQREEEQSESSNEEGEEAEKKSEK